MTLSLSPGLASAEQVPDAKGDTTGRLDAVSATGTYAPRRTPSDLFPPRFFFSVGFASRVWKSDFSSAHPVRVFLDTFGGPRADYSIHVLLHDTRLDGRLYRIGQGMSTASVWVNFADDHRTLDVSLLDCQLTRHLNF